MANDFSYQCQGAQNCGDAVALAVNPYLEGKKLPRGGLGEGEIREVAQSYNAPVFGRNDISVDTLNQMGPGTIIRMTRKPGDRNYQYGDTHAEVLAINPNTGKLSVASYTQGQGTRYKPLNENYVNNLPKQSIATNLFGSGKNIMPLMLFVQRYLIHGQ